VTGARAGRRVGTADVEAVADQPAQEERAGQREQRDTGEPGGLEELRRGHRREGEERQPGDRALAVTAQDLARGGEVGGLPRRGVPAQVGEGGGEQEPAAGGREGADEHQRHDPQVLPDPEVDEDGPGRRPEGGQEVDAQDHAGDDEEGQQVAHRPLLGRLAAERQPR